MIKKLNEFLESIDPERILEKDSARVYDALVHFPMPAKAITQWMEYENFMARLYCHLECAFLGIYPARAVNHGFDWGRCQNLLIRIYGHDGWKSSFDMTRTGMEGGLGAVVNAVAQHLITQYSNNGIESRVLEFWNSLSTDDKISTAKEYIEKFRHFIPPELTESGAVRIIAEFPRVLAAHPYMLLKLRKIGR